eukprot:2598562-Prymnesium_polylepis.1
MPHLTPRGYRARATVSPTLRPPPKPRQNFFSASSLARESELQVIRSSGGQLFSTPRRQSRFPARRATCE